MSVLALAIPSPTERFSVRIRMREMSDLCRIIAQKVGVVWCLCIWECCVCMCACMMNVCECVCARRLCGCVQEGVYVRACGCVWGKVYECVWGVCACLCICVCVWVSVCVSVLALAIPTERLWFRIRTREMSDLCARVGCGCVQEGVPVCVCGWVGRCPQVCIRLFCLLVCVSVSVCVASMPHALHTRMRARTQSSALIHADKRICAHTQTHIRTHTYITRHK